MKKIILPIYLYLVCFVTLIVGVVSLGNIVYDGLKINDSEFYMSEYQKMTYINNEKYVLSINLKNNLNTKYTNDKITKMRNEEYSFVIQSVSREAQKSLVSYTISLVLSLIIFFIHWNISKKMKEF